MEPGGSKRTKVDEMSEEDKELQDELKLLVDKILGKDEKLIQPALEMLRFLIRTSTTSMTSVPKPLKYLAPYYYQIRDGYAKVKDQNIKKVYADVVSILAMSQPEEQESKKLDCLKFCLLGTLKNIGDWGHEYIRQLEAEIIEYLYNAKLEQPLLGLIKDIIHFDCKHHAEIQACDLLMEIDRLDLLPPYIDRTIYQRICLYLLSCTKYVDEIESEKIMRLILDQYRRFNEEARALIIAINLNDSKVINDIFLQCKNVSVLRQLAFITARHLYSLELDDNILDKEELNNILNNSYLSGHFLTLARELDIMEPKLPEDVYKTWLEPTPLRPAVLGENIDSARQNLASSFVNGFVNAAFGVDKLLTPESGNKWIYRNKERGMFSATASLGLLHLWDVDGGLTPIDKYLYSKDDQIKAGALLALGIVNCRVRNECDPALALLADFVSDKSIILQIGAIFGLGLAYIGTNRDDVINLITPVIESTTNVEVLAVASIACGLIGIGSCNSEITNTILTKLVDWREMEILKSSFMHFVVLGLGLCYIGRKDAIETSSEALEVFTEPFSSTAKSILNVCAYAGTGDVFMIQELLNNCGEKVVMSEDNKSDTSTKKSDNKKLKSKYEWDPTVAQTMLVLGLGAVSVGEEMGTEMCQRLLGSVGRYGDAVVRRAVPLAIALISVSKADLPSIDILTKYSHDPDEKVACNAIFALGIVGAGTNNARLAATLRQLAVFHVRNPLQLFMVRLAQGLTYLGKGTLTLSPLHTDRQLIDNNALAGLLIPFIALLDPHSMILGKTHYLLYALAASMNPRWLLMLDENLEPVNVPVRVGQGVDVVGKAGTPKTIAGIHTHTTPVLLASGEKAELATDQYEQIAPVLDGICIITKRPD